MLTKEFWGLLFLGFVAWIFISATPGERIDKACRPIAWGGNVVTSVAAMAAPSGQTMVQKWFDNLEYGCRYTTWRLFYQRDFNEWHAAQQRQAQQNDAADAAGGAPDAPASPTPPAPPVRGGTKGDAR